MVKEVKDFKLLANYCKLVICDSVLRACDMLFMGEKTMLNFSSDSLSCKILG